MRKPCTGLAVCYSMCENGVMKQEGQEVRMRGREGVTK